MIDFDKLQPGQQLYFKNERQPYTVKAFYVDHYPTERVRRGGKVSPRPIYRGSCKHWSEVKP